MGGTPTTRAGAGVNGPGLLGWLRPFVGVARYPGRTPRNVARR